ncbi:MAG: RNA polymerase sigma factor [Chloroflexota bacterium]|nr:RNA polymerase sigma factor [Chloroflexota bacterium]
MKISTSNAVIPVKHHARDVVADELVQRAQAGDQAAFNQLVGPMLDRVYAVAYRILRNGAQAEDATQRAMVSAWRRLPTLRDPSRFEGWVHRILVNECRNELRDRRKNGTPLESDDNRHRAPGDAYGAVDDRDALDRAFLRLSTDHRAVLVLRHYLMLSSAEIAVALGVPTGTVHSRLHYATDALRAALEADERAPAAVPQEIRQ